jgi:hypothetical protein
MSTLCRPGQEGSSRDQQCPQTVSDSVEGKELGQSACNRVAGIPPLTPQDKRHYVGCQLRQPDAWSILPCQMK